MGGGIPHVFTVGVPDLHHIIIPPTGQKSPVWRPLQSADVHLVCPDRGDMELSHSGVVVVDEALLVSAAQEACLGTPGQAVNTTLVGSHSSNQLPIVDVPQLSGE